MTLLDDLHDLQAKHRDAPRHQRIALDLAASLVERIVELETGQPVAAPTLVGDQDYLDLPEVFELDDGKITPKRWAVYREWNEQHPEEWEKMRREFRQP